MHLIYINQTGFQWVARTSALPLLFPFIVVSGMKYWSFDSEIGTCCVWNRELFLYNWPIKVFFSILAGGCHSPQWDYSMFQGRTSFLFVNMNRENDYLLGNWNDCTLLFVIFRTKNAPVSTEYVACTSFEQGAFA